MQVFLQSILQSLDGLGFWSPIAFILLYIIASVLWIPGTILTLGAGAIYGVLKGSILVSIASTFAATTAFLIGRYLGQSRTLKAIEKRPNFAAINEAVSQSGWRIVALTRLSPLFPFVFLNYAFGVTKISLKDYVLASWLGMIPGTIVYVYLGSLIGNIAQLTTSSREKSPLEWFFYIFGLAITIFGGFYVTNIAKKALSKKITLNS